jgi:hypothetical protein
MRAVNHIAHRAQLSSAAETYTLVLGEVGEASVFFEPFKRMT